MSNSKKLEAFEQVAESSVLKFIVRVGTPLLVAVLGYMFTQMTDNLDGLVGKVEQISIRLYGVQAEQRVLSTQIDNVETSVGTVRKTIDQKVLHSDTKILNNSADIKENKESIRRLWRQKEDKSTN